MKARYIRTSSSSQNNQRQIAKSFPDETLFIDVCSGGIEFSDRPQAKELLFHIVKNEVEVLSVSSVDRLGRNAFDIQSTIDYLNQKKINLKIDNLGIESFVNGKPNPIFKMIVDVLANVAQMEREAIKERQSEGIAIAKASGKYQQRATRGKISNEAFLSTYKNVVKELNAGTNSMRKIAKLCDVSLDTVQRVKKAMNENEKGIN